MLPHETLTSLGVRLAKFELGAVFGNDRDVPETYVERNGVDDRFVRALSAKKHIVVHGSSKQGKTALRKKHLKEQEYVSVHCQYRWSARDLYEGILKQFFEVGGASSQTSRGTRKIGVEIKAGIPGLSAAAKTEIEQSPEKRLRLEFDPEDPNDIVHALRFVGSRNTVCIEDFHYLDDDVQRQFASALKAFTERSSLVFIIIGVWLEQNKLVSLNRDLGNRVLEVNADRWPDEGLHEVIEKGERCLRIKFPARLKNEIVENCAGSVSILQQACYKICWESDVSHTCAKRTQVGRGMDGYSIVRDIVMEQSAAYSDALSRLKEGHQKTRLRIHYYLTYALFDCDVLDLERGLSSRDVYELISNRHPKGESLNMGNVIQALKSIESLQANIDIKPFLIGYDPRSRRIYSVDRGFLIWKKFVEEDEVEEVLAM